MDPNLTTVERIVHYVQTEQYEKAETLVALADYLEEAFEWELSFNS